MLELNNNILNIIETVTYIVLGSICLLCIIEVFSSDEPVSPNEKRDWTDIDED